MINQDDARNLTEKVLSQARDEADRLLAEAENFGRQRMEQTDRQIENETAAAEKKIAEERQKILQRSGSAITVEKRRIRQQLREQLMQELETECYRAFQRDIGTAAWGEILQQWIVEGAVAIDRDHCLVNASADEKKQIDRKLLDAAESRYGELTGRKIRLELSGREPEPLQGIVVESADGRVSYSNQLKTRWHRRQARLREMLAAEFVEPLLSAQGEFHE